MSTWRRDELHPGIYDELVSERLAAALDHLQPELVADREPLSGHTDLSVSLGATLRGALDLALNAVSTEPTAARALAEAVLDVLQQHQRHTFRDDELRFRAERLRAITKRPETVPRRPQGSLHVSGLLVNAPGDSLLDHLRSEFESADRVDLLCAFVKLSGFDKLRSELEQHGSARGRPLRVLTTTYMAASDLKAIERLAALPNATVKISFDDNSTRLHAKAWLFHRDSGYTTAYVGSSNLSHAAQTDGLEWNVRATASDQPALIAQMSETFEQYWADANAFEAFVPGDLPQRARLVRALQPEDGPAPTFLPEIEPKDFQRPVLAELEEARRLGRHRNLLVAATGTGKTVMAALDYARLRAEGAVQTLLFVAHRKEILVQARDTFRAALQIGTFGELLVDGMRPTVGRHVFASIDSLGEGSSVDPAVFDCVIVDEAHHSAAESWTRLLARISPKELLGLTGTPERADGMDYEAAFPRPWIGNLRVWNAIPHALVPFRYFALDVEGADLRDVAWRAGRYAPEALAAKLLGAAEIFVHRAIAAITEHVARPSAMRALAFCANIAHAHAVAERFVAEGFKAEVLTGKTDGTVRQLAKDRLTSGEVQILCVVDLYNEGVDVPQVNTLFFFRPTESATVFLQQLGRGLRRSKDKSELVVFDLTGRQHHAFRFDRRLRALLGHTPSQLKSFVQDGFGRLPAGCHFEFEERVRNEILAQLRAAIPTDRKGLRQLLADPALRTLSLGGFLHETDVELADIFSAKQGWTSLRREVGLITGQMDPDPDQERALTQVHKLISVGDALRLNAWDKFLRLELPSSESERRLARMLFAVLYGKDAAVDDVRTWARWTAHGLLRAELEELLPVLRRRNAVLAPADQLAPGIPLALHARYLGVELSAAFDHRTATGLLRDYYTGVEATPGGRFDLLLVTLEKSEQTKEHLKYRDFPLHERRFHWQSKSATRRDSGAGKRLLRPETEGCTPLLFVRERADDRPGVTQGFRYLGPVRPDGDQGERPITVEWALEHPMPRDLLTAGRIAG